MRFPISIIIPIYNEEKKIGRCLERLTSFCNTKKWDYEIIVVEDGCKDKSVDIVKEYQSKNNEINLVSLSKRLGKGGSLLKAIEYCKKPNVGYMDVDLAADPVEFDRLIPFINSFDLIVGSRILRGNLPPIKRPKHRSLLSHFYLLFFKCLFRINIYDLQCGFKLFKKERIQKIIPFIKTNGFAFDTEFIVMAYAFRLKVMEVPINWTHYVDSRVNIAKAILNMSTNLLEIWSSIFRSQFYNNILEENYFIARPIIISKLLNKYASKNSANIHKLVRKIYKDIKNC